MGKLFLVPDIAVSRPELGARIKTYGEVLREYEFHLSAKSADAKGKPSGNQSVGLLRRKRVRVEQIIYIGRESNRLEAVKSWKFEPARKDWSACPSPNRVEVSFHLFQRSGNPN